MKTLYIGFGRLGTSFGYSSGFPYMDMSLGVGHFNLVYWWKRAVETLPV